jgi:hypothetical protein
MFKKSKGKIICFLDGDDFFFKNKLNIHGYILLRYIRRNFLSTKFESVENTSFDPPLPNNISINLIIKYPH